MPHKSMCLVSAILAALAAVAAAETPEKRVLVVMDEREAMEALSEYLSVEGGVEAEIVEQSAVPGEWSGYAAVIGYVHGDLEAETERLIIEYTRGGGRYVCLHHMISSGKAANEHYFEFLGVALEGVSEARNPAQPGGHYAWREPVRLTVVNLNPSHYITSHGVSWPDTTRYRPSDSPSVEGDYPSFTLDPAEVYMNHSFTDGRAKTVLLGYKYRDDRNGVLYMQDREGWLKRSGQGWIVYLQMGHFADEFRHPAVAQMVLNAINWRSAGD